MADGGAAAQRHEHINCQPEQFPGLAAAYQRSLPSHEWQAMRAWLTTFYPFQVRWLLEPARRATCTKSRQIGWSHTTSGNGTIWGAFHGELTTVISKGQKESNEVLEKAELHAKVLAQLGSKLAKPVKSNSEEIHFASGGRIIALPSSGGRSFTGNVVIDEYAYHQDRKKVWDAAAAVTMLGDFRLRVISTPNGVGDEFHDLIEGVKTRRMKRWGYHEVTIDDAIAEGYPVDIEECWALAKGDPRIFDQLFRCKFLDNELQYIPSDAVMLCLDKKIQHIDPRTGYGFYAGLDIGETHDRTVIVVVFMDVRGVRWLRWMRSCKRTDFKALERMVAEVMHIFGPHRLCIDATGLGTFEAQRFQAKYGEQRVEAVRFGESSKEVLATSLYNAVTNRTIYLPFQDGSCPDVLKQRALPPGGAEELRDDLTKIKRIITKSGNVRYDAPRTAHGHADSAWALALALHACSAPISGGSSGTLPNLA